jgi:hypothetical protein
MANIPILKRKRLLSSFIHLNINNLLEDILKAVKMSQTSIPYIFMTALFKTYKPWSTPFLLVKIHRMCYN